MRVNTRVFTERMDMLDGIRIPNCPSQFKIIAENILNMATKPGFSIGDYNTMSELDKKLMLAYWYEYDGLKEALYDDPKYFDNWFISKATNTELLRRSREFLVSHNYLICKPDVQQRALDAGIKMSKAISH